MDNLLAGIFEDVELNHTLDGQSDSKVKVNHKFQPKLIIVLALFIFLASLTGALIGAKIIR